jgi:hypothetical protein
MSIFTLITTATTRMRAAMASVRVLVMVSLAIGLYAFQANAEGTESAPVPTLASGADAGCDLCNGIRLQDEIFVVNVRPACGSCSPEILRKTVAVETYTSCDEVGHRRWMHSDLDSFVASDPSVATIIFINGNQITPSDAMSEGLTVYRRLIRFGCDAPKIRFVIFSWPSAKVPGLLNDVRVKAARTGPAGCQLAWLIDQMPAETPVSLIGFSFGARIITGGLQILAGGNLGGSLALQERVHPDRPPMNVVLIAAALHAHWLGTGQHHGLAMTQVDRMLLLNNCQDRAMVYYDWLTPGRGGPQALGLRGPTCIDSEGASKIRQRDMSGYVGAQHDLMLYLCGSGPLSQIWTYTGGAAVGQPVAAK